MKRLFLVLELDLYYLTCFFPDHHPSSFQLFNFDYMTFFPACLDRYPRTTSSPALLKHRISFFLSISISPAYRRASSHIFLSIIYPIHRLAGHHDYIYVHITPTYEHTPHSYHRIILILSLPSVHLRPLDTPPSSTF